MYVFMCICVKSLSCMYVCVYVYMCMLSLNDEHAFAGWVLATLVAISKPLRMSCMYVSICVYVYAVVE
jgi:hypothetical protein